VVLRPVYGGASLTVNSLYILLVVCRHDIISQKQICQVQNSISDFMTCDKSCILSARQSYQLLRQCCHYEFEVIS